MSLHLLFKENKLSSQRRSLAGELLQHPHGSPLEPLPFNNFHRDPGTAPGRRASSTRCTEQERCFLYFCMKTWRFWPKCCCSEAALWQSRSCPSQYLTGRAGKARGCLSPAENKEKTRKNNCKMVLCHPCYRAGDLKCRWRC